MNLVVILLAGAVPGVLAGLLFRGSGVMLNLILGAWGGFLVLALDNESLLTGPGPLALCMGALGGVALVVFTHALGRMGLAQPGVVRE